MNEALKIIVKQFVRKLGGQLEALYLYGSVAQAYHQPGESDVNLLAVVADGTNIHVLRAMFQPIWEEYGVTLKRAPLIAAKTTFGRYLQLNPLLAHHVARDGKLLYGAPDFLDKYLPPLNPNEAYAHLAAEAVATSKALAPQLLEPETAVAVRRQLRRLARRIRRAPIDDDETDAQLFARVQHYLNPIIARLPASQQWAGAKSPAATSPLLPGLQTIYRTVGRMVLVFSQLTPQQIVRTDWARLSERVASQCTGIQISSTIQLCLILSFAQPLDLYFRKFEHSWGPDFLPGLTPSPRQVLRQAGSLPTHVLVDALPNALLTEDDEALPKIIHDFQNKLLNVQLEHELLSRMGVVERFTPPAPLPGQDTPSSQRIDAILQHLEWWSDFYFQQMNQHAPD